MNHFLVRLETALIRKAVGVFAESLAGPQVPIPQLEKREDLTPEEVEDAWIQWATEQRIPEASFPALASAISSYSHFRMVPKGFGSAQRGATTPAAGVGGPDWENPENYVPSGPMTRNRFGKLVRADAGVGRPPPGLARKR
jgi:hypothetical protein